MPYYWNWNAATASTTTTGYNAWNYDWTNSTTTASTSWPQGQTQWINNPYNNPYSYTGSAVVRPGSQQALRYRALGAVGADAVREAEERARELLLAVLDPAELVEYEASGRKHFHVHGADGKIYRLKRGNGSALIEDGRERESYCLHPAEWVPADDVMVAHKLLLETDPDTFRQLANVT